MKVIYNRFIPFKGFIACNLFGVVFVRKSCADEVDVRVLRHEYVHTLQMKELWYIGFYILYALFYIKNLTKKHMDDIEAYHAIPFEREAFYNEDNEFYSWIRPKFNWRKYI